MIKIAENIMEILSKRELGITLNKSIKYGSHYAEKFTIFPDGHYKYFGDEYSNIFDPYRHKRKIIATLPMSVLTTIANEIHFKHYTDCIERHVYVRYINDILKKENTIKFIANSNHKLEISKYLNGGNIVLTKNGYFWCEGSNKTYTMKSSDDFIIKALYDDIKSGKYL